MKAFSKRMIVGISTFLAAFSGQINADCCDCYDLGCERFWFDADYLYWQIKNSPKPVPLVIDQPTADGPFTTVLGGKNVDLGWRSGGRFALGYWFDDTKDLGAEINYFFLGNKSKSSTVFSDATGSPRLRVPFFNVVTGLEDSSALATPGVYFGAASLKLKNSMQGAELNVLAGIPSCDCHMKFGLFAGFRWWNFDEHLKFIGDSPAIAPVSIYNYEDKFHTENNFYGGQIGANFDYNYCAFLFNLKGKIALGAMCQESVINGSFTTNEFNGTEQVFEGGFFAQPSNIGKHKKTTFAWLPQIDVNLGYQFTDCLTVRVGYSVLYVNKVLYTGKQIDRNINPSQSANLSFTPTPVLDGVAAPTSKTRSQSLWAQGVNVGLEFQF